MYVPVTLGALTNILTLDDTSISIRIQLLFSNDKKNTICKRKSDENSFKFLDYAKKNYELPLKEAMHIKWGKPKLCIQKKCNYFFKNIKFYRFTESGILTFLSSVYRLLKANYDYDFGQSKHVNI